MDSFEFHCPTKIVCGKNALRKLPQILEEQNVTKPLLVTDANLVSLGVCDHAITPLEENGIPYAQFSDVPPDSSLDVVNRVANLYDECECDGFIALGGGSVIDTTKGAAASIAMNGKDFEKLQGAEIITTDLDPIVAIPTTAGTGSEVTLVAVVKDQEAHAKLSFTSYKLVPHVAILDPKLTSSLPPKLTATTGIDAMTHAIEAYTSVQKNPVSDAFAHEAIRLIAANLVECCENGKNEDARCALALGSLMAGASFSNAMVGIVHALGHSLGGLAGIPHGQAMMLLLPHCVRWNLDHGYHTGLYGELLGDLRPDKASRGLTPRQADEAFCSELFSLNEYLNRTYGVPISLKELGVETNQLSAIAKQARYDGAALYNCQDFSLEEATEILEAAF